MRVFGWGQRGFTAYELLVALCLTALLATLAVPGFGALRRAAGLTAASHELMGALHLARSSAVTRGVPAILCLTADELTCLGGGGRARGWLVFHSQAVRRSGPEEIEAGLVQRFRLPGEVTVSGTRAAVTFWPVARAGTTATFTLCDLSGASPGRAVVVSQTGRPRVSSERPQCVR